MKKIKRTLQEELDIRNVGCKILIKVRRLVKASTLYLDYSKKNIRQRKYLKFKVFDENNLTNKDLEAIHFADMYRNQLEIEEFTNQDTFSLVKQSDKIYFLEYYERFAKKKKLPSYLGCLKHLKIFAAKKYGTNKMTFSEVDYNFCNHFREYLLEAIAVNTARTYMKLLSACLNHAVEERIINKNHCRKLSIKEEDGKREFLTESELRSFVKAKTNFVEEKKAFIFACQCGLRLGDIRALKFADIQGKHMSIRQQKTRGIIRMMLSPDAIEIVKQQKKSFPQRENVFVLPASRTDLNEHLTSIKDTAKINKNISFSCSRHSFAVLCITSGIDIFTLSKLLGHTSVNTTLIYSKLIDEKRDEYTCKIPQLLKKSRRT
ncbi:MAG: site-specific integrase [Candidatus Kapabacteria bacterium]|nr:site-specific integrase [Candidatus Kapabacteria bacterium]